MAMTKKPAKGKLKAPKSKDEAIALAPPPALPTRLSDSVSIDKIVDECGKDAILSALNLSQNPKIKRFVELWRISPQKSMDELCTDADVPGDVLIGTAAQLLVKVNASVTKIIMACGHPPVMRRTVEQALVPRNFDERMAFHTMMGLQTQPTSKPLLQQTFNLANQGVPSLAQCPDPINVHPLDEGVFDASPQEEDVPATLAPAQPAAGTGSAV